jgi:multidrug efflux pump subunit AcrB
VRQITIDLDLQKLNGLGLSPNDVLTAVNAQNIILPTGTVKLGQTEYNVGLNSSPEVVDQLNNLPVKTVNGTVIYMRDVAHVRDGFQVQTNVVRQDGRRGSLLSVYKTGNASTLDIVRQVREALPFIAATLPAQLRIQPLFDQSLFVRAAVDGVIKEAIIAARLTALMILLFLGNWRHTIVIAISIPLSILTSICIFSALGETINIMTLGGLALAVGILVDDATVTIENINRHLEEGKELNQGILDAAAQIATPAFVSTLCICIVFVPMFFLSGVARYLFVPLAELPREFPGIEFFFQPADIVSQILNFGISAPVDVQFVGNDVMRNLAIAQKVEARIREIPGAVDTHIYQLFNQPRLDLDVDRSKASQSGLTERDVANSLLVALSSSAQVSPTYWLNPMNGVTYSLACRRPNTASKACKTSTSCPSAAAIPPTSCSSISPRSNAGRRPRS